MERININNISDLSNICRICLKNEDGLYSLFHNKNINKKIMTCTMIEIDEKDGLPSQICNTCLMNLYIACDFRELCERSDTILRQYIKIHKKDGIATKDELIEDDKYEIREYEGSYQNSDSQIAQEEIEWKTHKVVKFRKPNAKLSKVRSVRKKRLTNEDNYISDFEIDKSRRVMCEVCGKLMQTRTALELHMRTHTDERPYRCHECAKAFRQKPSLMNHIRTHSDERPFLCAICSKGCRTKQDLKVHMRCHTQEQPYKCKMCDRKFSTSSNLAKHVNVIHLNERKYKCTICEAAFNIRFSLNKHIRWHESTEESYLCPVCNKTIKRCNISLHIKRMHPEQPNVLPYTCRVCNMQFGNELGLQAHLRQLHSINTAIGQTIDNPLGTIDKSYIPKI